MKKNLINNNYFCLTITMKILDNINWFSYQGGHGTVGQNFYYENCKLKKVIGSFPIGTRVDQIKVDLIDGTLSFQKKIYNSRFNEYTTFYTSQLQLCETKNFCFLEYKNKLLKKLVKHLQQEIIELKARPGSEDYLKAMERFIENKYK